MTIETKAKVQGALVKAKGAIDKVSMTAVGAASAVGLTGISVSAVDGVTTTQPVIDVSSVDFTGLTNAITSMVPQVLPVSVTVLGIRKAISFMMSTIRGC